jgi:hypothetical protein
MTIDASQRKLILTRSRRACPTGSAALSSMALESRWRNMVELL